MICGDNPRKINERKSDDPLGLNTYTLVPDINAITQSSNLYVYCGNNPIMYVDRNGEIFMLVTGSIGAVVGGIGGAIYSQVKYGEVRWQNVAAGAAIGGAVGLTGGAAAGAIFAGSATASTGAVLTGMGIAGAGAAGGAGGVIYKTLEQGVNFANKALEHMGEIGRQLPVQTLIETIKQGACMSDPQGSRALMYYSQIIINGSRYNLEVLYDKVSNSIWHFMYY